MRVVFVYRSLLLLVADWLIRTTDWNVVWDVA